jgi:hypothetical protein
MLVNVPTAEEVAANTALMLEVLAELRQVRQLLARPADEYLTIDEVAAKVKKSSKTVRKWIDEGKYAANGQLLKLQTLEGSPGSLLVPLAALHAFLSNMDFDLASLATATSPLSTQPVLDSSKALRKAS